MSNKNKDMSGPAFPVNEMGVNDQTQLVQQHFGMTLRDWFAGLAVQGMYANQSFDESGFMEIAELAYAQADAMLDFRKG